MDAPEHASVVVVGAGLAGLAALDALGRRGIATTVVEARTRPGGRVFTLRDPFSAGLHVEAGAQYIPSGHRLALHYARELGLTLDQVEAPPRLLHVQGRTHVAGRPPVGPPPFEFTAEERRLGLAGVLGHYLGEALRALAPHALERSVPECLRRYDELTMAQLLAAGGASPGLIARLRIGYLNHWGDGIDAYSGLFGLRDLALNDTTEEYVVRGGTDRLPAGLARRWEGRILYDAPVTAIEQGSDRVVVVVGRGAQRRRFTARFVICTLPLPVLRDLPVEPDWSAPKQAAFDQVPYTAVSKTFLEVRERFWDAQGLAGHQSMLDSPKLCVWDRTALQRRSPGPGVLEASFTGPDARRLLALAPAERLAYVLDQAQRIYPTLRDQVRRSTSLCWDEDPWARGGYAWFRPGQMAAHLPHLSSPEGRVHFAGDHASARPGWIEGALESGLRAAREVEERLSA